MLYFDNVKRIHTVHLFSLFVSLSLSPLLFARFFSIKREEKARQTTEVKREALVHLTKRIYRQIYIHEHTYSAHMRMGFRPLVNLPAPMSANFNSIFSSTTSRSFVNPFLNQSSSFSIDNNHPLQQQQQQDDNNNANDDDPELKVELENKQLWDAFHAHGTEMVRLISFFLYRKIKYVVFF
mgnify:FL=1